MYRVILRNIITTAVLIGLSVILIYWIEAEKEIRILCSMFIEGASTEQVTNTLDTANLLDYNVNHTINGHSKIQAESPYDLYSVECTILFDEEGNVIKADFLKHFDLNAYLTLAASFVLLLLTGFHLLLSLGLQYGKFAWGGYHKILPVHLRIGSFISSLLLIFGMIILLDKVEWIQKLPDGFPFSEFNIFFTVIFLMSTLANVNSDSAGEKQIMAPLAGILYMAFLSNIFTL